MVASSERPGDLERARAWDPEALLVTPLAYELEALARQILGPGPAVAESVRGALAEPCAHRLEAIARTAAQCRRRDRAGVGSETAAPGTFAETMLAELELAHASLVPRHREAMALRDLCRLSHAQIGAVMGLGASAVALLLARARIALRDELRRPGSENPARPTLASPRCPEGDRALGLLARRQDSEPTEPQDDVWIGAHLAACDGCERAHAKMLEAAFRYRAWVRPRRGAAVRPG